MAAGLARQGLQCKQRWAARLDWEDREVDDRAAVVLARFSMQDPMVQLRRHKACPTGRWTTHGQPPSHGSPATSRWPPIALFCVCSWRGCTDRLEKAAHREAMAAALCRRAPRLVQLLH